MSDILEGQVCSIHKLENLVADLSPNLDGKRKFLCVRCLTDKIASDSSLVLIEEFKTLMSDVKLKKIELKNKHCEQQILKYSTVQSSLYSYADFIKISISKVQELLNQKIESVQKEQQKLNEQKEEKFNDNDYQQLQQTYQGNYLLQFSDLETNNENSIEFDKLLKEQIIKINESQEFVKIFNQLDSIMNKEEYTNKMNVKSINQNEIRKKIRQLPHLCKKHDEDIVMFNLEPENDQKLVCLSCISEYKPKQLITLDQANNQWMEYQGQIFEKKLNLHIQREQKQSSIKKTILEFQQFMIKSLNELLQITENQYYNINLEILSQQKQQFDKKPINQLDYEQLIKVVILLADKQKQKEFQEYKNKYESQDQIFYSELINKMNLIYEYNSQCKGQLSKLTLSLQQSEIKQSNDLQKQNDFSQSQVVSQPFITQQIQTKVHSEIQLQKLDQIEIQQIQQQNMNQEIVKSKFSTQLKHQKIKLSDDCQIAETQEKSNQVCLLEQAIPLTGIHSIEFFIKKMHSISVGVCQKDKLKDKYDIGVYTTAKETWSYLMYYSGFTCFHQQNEQKQNFLFKENDIIRIEVNQKEGKITWINKSQTYTPVTADIPTSQFLYFCFLFHGQNVVQLL